MKTYTFNGIKNNTKEGFYNINNIFVDIKGDYYFLSNDEIRLDLKYYQHNDNVVFIGIGNPHFFHALSVAVQKDLRIKRIICVDNNWEQILHFDRIRRYIISSWNRIEFLQKLFRVRFNAESIRLLGDFSLSSGFVQGCSERDRFYRLEKKIWNNLKFYKEDFEDIYKLKVDRHEAGLEVSANVIGEFDKYYITFICASKKDYKYLPFTAGFGTGFLKNEQEFLRLRDLLLDTPVYQLNHDITDVYEDLILSNRYSPILFWASNTFDPFFIKKYKKFENMIYNIIDLGTSKKNPEIDIMLIQDNRIYNKKENIKLPKEIEHLKKHTSSWSIHTLSFFKVNKYLRGRNNIEIVNVKRWIEEDNGLSKLPNTEYRLADDFMKEGDCLYTSIFIHILVGHGMEKGDYRRLIEKAYSSTSNLIILEHNIDSKDFKKRKIGLPSDFIRNILGEETFFDFCPGKKCKDRNLLMVYRSNELNRF